MEIASFCHIRVFDTKRLFPIRNLLVIIGQVRWLKVIELMHIFFILTKKCRMIVLITETLFIVVGL